MLSRVIKLIAFLLLLFFLSYFYQGVYLAKSSSSKEINIEKGEDLFQIARRLEKEKLIKNNLFFEVYVLLTRKARLLQAGHYKIEKGMTIPEIVKKLVSGNVIKKKITIIEGWNLRDIGFYFENKALFGTEEFFEVAGFPAVDYSQALPTAKNFSKDFPFLKEKPDRVGLEGYLFPDTYEIYPNESLESIIRKMLSNFDKKISPFKKEIKAQEKTIFEVITMASLLEKEVKDYEDKRIVAGILWKRLKNRIPLQVDATITYITGKKTAKISKSETEIDSPFNTYKYPGLPLGPICNPSLESIRAVLNPKQSNYWYYLSTPEQTFFSRSLKEHNIKKAKYLK